MSDKSGARFIDVEYNELFRLPQGEKLLITWFDNHSKLVPCERIDEYHIIVDHRTWHICEFAEYCRRAGAVFRPEHPQPGDMIGYYEIYQIQDSRSCKYCFRPYEEAKRFIQSSDYHRVYTGNLADCVGLEHLWQLHNADSRPFGQRMRSMSMSDIIVTHRADGERAFYADNYGFQQLSERITEGLRLRPNAPERHFSARDSR